MRNSLVATIASAVIAGLFTFLTEPVPSTSRDLAKSPTGDISKSSVKGDRLDLRPTESCLFAPEGISQGSRCLRERARGGPSITKTVIVNLWSIESRRIRTTDSMKIG
jgi:hypothetical protein